MTGHRIPIQAKTPLTSTKKIGRMIDKLETDTKRVEKQIVKPDSIEEGCAVGLAIGVLIWIALILLITKFLGVW